MAKTYFQQKFERHISKITGEWLYKATGNLGRSIANGRTIETGTSGIVWVRTTNGQEVTAYNKIAPSIWDTHLVLGISKSMPNIWQVIEVRETYAAPASSFVINHAAQHLLTGTDTVFSDRKQILSMTILVSDSAGFKVRVFGGIPKTNTTGWTLVPNTGTTTNPDPDLSSYIPSDGAVYVTIEHDIAGVLYVHAGTPFAAKELATSADIPAPALGRYPIGCILLYESMPALLNEHITVFSPAITDYSSVDMGTQIHAATEVVTLINADEIGFWNSVTGLLGKITFASLVAQLTSIFNLLYAPFGFNDVGHVHGLARWVADGSVTAFDLPDYAAYIESVTDDGNESDAIIYSLSTDGSQVIYDSAPTAAQVIQAHYVIATI